MYAVVAKVSINDAEAAEKHLNEEVVPRVSQAPGFVAGYWTRSDDRSNGLAMIVFESQQAAQAAADNIPHQIPEAVTLQGTEVREVVTSA
jgi:hypothetical protein